VCALYRPGWWLWVDSNGTDGKPTFRRFANLSYHSAICNHFGEIAAWSPKSLKIFPKKLPFRKKDPLRENFQNVVPKGFTASRIHVLYAHFVKFGLPEIDKLVRYLRDQKQFPFALPLSVLRGSCPKSVRAGSRQYTRSTLNFIKSVLVLYLVYRPVCKMVLTEFLSGIKFVGP